MVISDRAIFPRRWVGEGLKGDRSLITVLQEEARKQIDCFDLGKSGVSKGSMWSGGGGGVAPACMLWPKLPTRKPSYHLCIH